MEKAFSRDEEMSTVKRRTVLITGCSDGGLGSALAIAFHKAGLHVYATARNPSKMANLVSMGIQTLTLDIQSSSSIAVCLSQVSSLDILVNNAGAIYSMPFSDISIPDTKKLFDLNVWSYLAVTQAFLPLLLKSKGMIVNQTSVAYTITLPFQSAYNASKAAMAMFSDSQRLELEPFGITVITLKSGSVQSNIQRNAFEATKCSLPRDSIYGPAKEAVEKAMRSDQFHQGAVPTRPWAEAVVKDLLSKKPPSNIWRGGQVWLVRLSTVLPFGVLDTMLKKMSGLDIVKEKIQR